MVAQPTYFRHHKTSILWQPNRSETDLHHNNLSTCISVYKSTCKYYADVRQSNWNKNICVVYLMKSCIGGIWYINFSHNNGITWVHCMMKVTSSVQWIQVLYLYQQFTEWPWCFATGIMCDDCEYDMSHAEPLHCWSLRCPIFVSNAFMAL